MDFDPISLSHDPLLDIPIDEINRASQIKRFKIIISGKCFLICFLVLSLTLVFIVMSKQQLWSSTTNTYMTTTSTSTRSNDLKTSTSENCFSSSWNPIGEILIKTGIISTLAVDDDFNVYTAEWNTPSLQKWLPGAEKPIDSFEERIKSSTIFYHSLSGSLYFFYIFNAIPGVYKLVDNSSLPVNVFSTIGIGSALNQLERYCGGLYLTSAGDIYVIDTNNYRVVKWVMNGTSGVLVAGDGHGLNSNEFGNPTGLFLDEINNVLYVLYQNHNCIRRYTNGSTNGVTVIGGGATTVLSDVNSEYINPISVFGDKMGNILVGESFKITKWTPDIKSSIVVTATINQILTATQASVFVPLIMTFDKLGNLYVYNKGYGHVAKFIRNSTPCMTNLH